MFVKPLKEKDSSTEPEKLNFIISVSDFGLIIVRAVNSKGLGPVSNGVADIIRIYKHHGWTLTSFKSDGEYNFENSLNLLINAPPHIPRGVENHDGRVEERVRRIQENIRAIQCGLPFNLGPQLLAWATYYSTYVSSLITKRLGDGISPRELLTDIKPNFKKCLPVAFGDFCQVLERDPNNTLKPRTVTPIALLPTGNGPVKIASLSTGKTITRENFKVVPNVPYEFLAILKSMQERNVLGIEELLKPGTQASEDEQKLNAEMAESELPPLIYDPADQGAHRGATDGADVCRK